MHIKTLDMGDENKNKNMAACSALKVTAGCVDSVYAKKFDHCL